MAEVIRYVNTASAGGDGTTNNEAGATAAYATLNAWEAAEQADLDTANNWMHVYCSTGSGTAADTIETAISGWTTSATDYILVEAGASDRASVSGWDTNKYRVDVAGAGTEGIFVADAAAWVYIDGLQIEQDGTDDCILYSPTSGLGRVSNCYLRTANYGIYHSQSEGSFSLIVWNTVITGMDNDGIYYRSSTGDFAVYNSIVYGAADDGIQMLSGNSFVAKNVASFNNGDDFLDSTAGTIDYCASDDGDGTNVVAPSGADWANEYVNAAAGDFTPVAGGNTNAGGVNDPGSGLYSAGMDGVAYAAGSWSIGVVQYVAAGGLSMVIAMYHYKEH